MDCMRQCVATQSASILPSANKCIPAERPSGVRDMWDLRQTLDTGTFAQAACQLLGSDSSDLVPLYAVEKPTKPAISYPQHIDLVRCLLHPRLPES